MESHRHTKHVTVSMFRVLHTCNQVTCQLRAAYIVVTPDQHICHARVSRPGCHLNLHHTVHLAHRVMGRYH
jgi:hypothetical protein